MYLIIGDIHGCYHTAKKLIEQHWDRKKEMLIQVGDLIDRGNYSFETVRYFRSLQIQYPKQVIVLKGNHESECIRHLKDGCNFEWLSQGGRKTVESYLRNQGDLAEDLEWFESLPLVWDNGVLCVSHAGFTSQSSVELNEDDPEGVLWARGPLKNLGKLQVVGHTPNRDGHPHYDAMSRTWYIDTGAFMGKNLTGIRISAVGELIAVCHSPTNQVDIDSSFKECG